MVELYTGLTLFNVVNDLDHLAMMEKVMGTIPPTIIIRGAESRPRYFQIDPDRGPQLNWPNSTTTEECVEDMHRLRPLFVSFFAHLSTSNPETV